MTLHFKVNEDVKLFGIARKAGTYFSCGDLPNKGLDAAIATGKVVNVAPEDVPQDEVELSETKDKNTMNDENNAQDEQKKEEGEQSSNAGENTTGGTDSQQDSGEKSEGGESDAQ